MKSLEYLATRNAGRFDIVEKDGPRTVFRLALDNGASGIVEDWELFEGVNLTFNYIPHGSLTWKSSEPRSLHIEWCQQGRGEIASANGKSYFIHERECAVHDQRIIKRQMRYPMPRYVGLTLSIEYETGSSTLRAHDATGGVDFNALRERYAGGDGCRIFLPDDTLASLLASFYRIDDRARIERMRLKALELVALLDATERPVWKTFPYCTHDHALALERALDLLGSNLDEDLALEDAARCANMGLSTFKQRFLHAYGLSPMAYRRQCRVEEGARLLAGSRESVASVAARVGYRNPSKFAAAFVERFGATPSAWRARG